MLLDQLETQQDLSEKTLNDFMLTCLETITTLEQRCEELENGLSNLQLLNKTLVESYSVEISKLRKEYRKDSIWNGIKIGGVSLGVGILIGLIIH